MAQPIGSVIHFNFPSLCPVMTNPRFVSNKPCEIAFRYWCEHRRHREQGNSYTHMYAPTCMCASQNYFCINANKSLKSMRLKLSMCVLSVSMTFTAILSFRIKQHVQISESQHCLFCFTFPTTVSRN